MHLRFHEKFFQFQIFLKLKALEISSNQSTIHLAKASLFFLPDGTFKHSNNVSLKQLLVSNHEDLLELVPVKIESTDTEETTLNLCTTRHIF